MDPILVGLLALQGDFAEHRDAIREVANKAGIKVEIKEIRKFDDLDQELDGLLLPGGESTVMSIQLDALGMRNKLTNMIKVDQIPTMVGLISRFM